MTANNRIKNLSHLPDGTISIDLDVNGTHVSISVHSDITIMVMGGIREAEKLNYPNYESVRMTLKRKCTHVPAKVTYTCVRCHETVHPDPAPP